MNKCDIEKAFKTASTFGERVIVNTFKTIRGKCRKQDLQQVLSQNATDYYFCNPKLSNVYKSLWSEV